MKRRRRRYEAYRTAILKILGETDGELSAVDVFRRLKQIWAEQPSLQYVYNAIRDLAQEGAVSIRPRPPIKRRGGRGGENYVLTGRALF